MVLVISTRLDQISTRLRGDNKLREEDLESEFVSWSTRRKTLFTICLLLFLSPPLPICSSPDGSYTEDHSTELHFKSRSSEFDDDFDDEEPLPSIGTCKSLYPFQGRYWSVVQWVVQCEIQSVIQSVVQSVTQKVVQWVTQSVMISQCTILECNSWRVQLGAELS